jgi:hypothetical protein
MKALEESQAWNDRIRTSKSPNDVYEILMSLSEMLKNGEYPFDNDTLCSFLEGMAGVIYSYGDSVPASWNLFAEVIAAATVYD